MRRLRYIAAVLVCVLFFPVSFAFAQQAHLTLFYTSDTHGHVIADADTLGMDLIRGVYKSTPNALLLDAGDYLFGTPHATLSRGKDIIDLMKITGYFAAAVGNHEFDYGRQTLERRKEEAESPPQPMRMLAANILRENGEPLFSPEASITVDGVKLCLFGLTTEATPIRTRPDNVAGLRFTGALDAAKAMAAKQRAEGCDVIIALSHVGSEKGETVTSLDLARELPEIDIIIDGHSHVTLEQKNDAGKLLVSPGAHGKFLGRLDIRFDKAEKKITAMTNALLDAGKLQTYTPDPAVADALALLAQKSERIHADKLASLATDLAGNHAFVRTREADLGSLCADALRVACGTELALINSGAIRDGLKKGQVSRGDIFIALPYRDKTVRVRVTGEELRRILEHGFAALPEAAGTFPQVSGLIVRVDTQKPAGARVVSLHLENGAQVVPEQEYSLTTNGFVASGGDGYPVFPDKEKTVMDFTLQEAVENYLIQCGTDGYGQESPRRILLQ